MKDEDEIGVLDEGTLTVMCVWGLAGIAVIVGGLVGLYYLIV